MATGAPDWQNVVTVVTSLTAGAPDWERTVVGPGGTPIGGGYASLTGPGETTTPGTLSQAGDFNVVAATTGWSLTGGTAGILQAGSVQINGATLTEIGNSSAGSTIVDAAPGGGGHGVEICKNGAYLGFFGLAVQPQPTVTGSCGGIVALQNLCAQLGLLGLIINSTTP